jgi:hypothetical protein
MIVIPPINDGSSTYHIPAIYRAKNLGSIVFIHDISYEQFCCAFGVRGLLGIFEEVRYSRRRPEMSVVFLSRQLYITSTVVIFSV